MSAEATRNAILDAAERLLSEVGYAAMSLRAVTQAAKANLASVNYHFGGKDGLAKAAMLRRIEPVDAERLARLAAIESKRRAPGADAVREVVEAFVGPVLQLAAQLGPAPCAMVGRMLTEEPPFLRAMLTEHFGPVAKRFATALQRAQPGMPIADAWWQLHFVVGAMTHTMLHLDLFLDLADKAVAPASADEITQRLAAFCAAGARAHTKKAARMPAIATARTATKRRSMTNATQPTRR
jgi:AcrR family transcriptional regulator